MRLGFVVCPSFHGATLLALLLNNHSRISALGDTIPTREYDQICACRENVSRCEFWQTIRARLDTDRFSHLGSMLPILPSPLSTHHVEGNLMRVTASPTVNRAAGRLVSTCVDAVLPVLWRRGSRTVEEYVETYRSFYDLVCELHGTSMFVDGSKSWRKVGLLARELGRSTEIRIVQLVRDPRGFAASWRRNIGDPDVRASAWMWSDLHRRMEDLREVAPHHVVRYEDLCERPEAELEVLFDFLGVEREEVISAPRHPAKNHLMGNAMLFAFTGRIALDERWRDELSPAEQDEVIRLAGRRAERLGYA